VPMQLTRRVVLSDGRVLWTWGPAVPPERAFFLPMGPGVP